VSEANPTTTSAGPPAENSAPASTVVEATGPAAPAIDWTQLKLTSDWEYASPLIACRFDSSGNFLLTAAQDNQIQRWDLSTGQSIVLAGHESWLRSFGFSPDGQTMYTGGYDGRLLFWPLADASPKPSREIVAHDGWIRGLSVSIDGQWIVTGGNDRLVKVWNAQDGQLVRTLSEHKNQVYSTLIPPLPDCLLSADLLGTVHQWELSSGKLMRTFDAQELHTFNDGQGTHYGGVRSMALSHDRRWLACGGLHKATNPFGAVQEPLVLTFDWQTGSKAQSCVAEALPQGIIWRVVYHPTGPLIGVSGGGSGGFLLFWKEGQDKPFHKLQLPNTALDMDLHVDGRRLATVHHDRRVRIASV
jgi:WD40 repeat protein